MHLHLAASFRPKLCAILAQATSATASTTFQGARISRHRSKASASALIGVATPAASAQLSSSSRSPAAADIGMPQRTRGAARANVSQQGLTAMEVMAVRSRAVERACCPLWFLLFLAAMCSVALQPGFLHGCMPNLPWLAAKPQALAKLQVPTTRHGSWLLGHLAGQANALLQGQMPAARGPAAHDLWSTGGMDDATMQQLTSIRQQAAQLMGVAPDTLSPQELQDMGQRIADKEKPSVVMTRVKGIFKFANVMWLVGILGVAISIGPAMVVLFGPLIQLLMSWARTLVTCTHLAARPFYDAALLYGCTCIVGFAQLQPEPAASRISLAGVALAMALLYFAVQRHLFVRIDSMPSTTQFLVDQPKWRPDPTLVINGYAFLALAPLAVAHKSQLLGFFAAAALFGALGFAVVPTGWGWIVGWGKRDNMMVTAIAAAHMVTALIVARAADPDRTWVAPFQLGFSVFGTLTLLLAGLIYCSSYYPRVMPYWVANAGYAALLTILTLAGALLGMDSMFSVGATYIALWLSEKLLDVLLIQRMGWVAVLVGSLGLCGGAYFIHTHPAWLAMLVS